MKQFKSGLEGLCKSLAEALGIDHSIVLTGIFANYKTFQDDSVTSRYSTAYAWKPKNRPSHFMSSWREHGEDEDYPIDEALARCIDALLGGNTLTNERLVNYKAIENARYGIYEQIISPFQSPHFHGIASAVISSIIPAMAEGFRGERYGDDYIRAFSADMQQLSASNPDDDVLLTRLIAAAIFGPVYACRYQERIGTQADEAYAELGTPDLLSKEKVSVTPVFDEYSSTVGVQQVLNPKDVLFVGRASDIAKYQKATENLRRTKKEALSAIKQHRKKLNNSIRQLKDVRIKKNMEEIDDQCAVLREKAASDDQIIDGLNKDLAFLKEIKHRDPHIMRIPSTCARTSYFHGCVVQHNKRWMFVELRAKNGTLIEDVANDCKCLGQDGETDGENQPLQYLPLKAGDTIHLGIREGDEESAASLRISRVLELDSSGNTNWERKCRKPTRHASQPNK